MMPDDARSRFPEQRRATKEITEGIEDKINDLHVLNAWKRTGEILAFLAIYCAGAGLVYIADETIALRLTGIIAMGIALNSLGILIHEGLHGLLARDLRTNHLLSFLIGLPILISAAAYRKTHSDHHWDLGRKRDYGTYKQHVANPAAIWFAYFLQLLLGTVIYAVFIPFLAFRNASRKTRVMIVLEYAAMILVYALFFLMVPTAVILDCWAYPLVVMSLLTNVRGLASHALSDTENILLSSRTVKCSKVMSYLFLHENFHLEHHLFPGVPSYNLPAVNALVWHRLPSAIYARSYRDFLLGFFRSAFKGELTPIGVVHPVEMTGSRQTAR